MTSTDAHRKRARSPARAARGFVAPGVFLVAVLLYLPLLWTAVPQLHRLQRPRRPELGRARRTTSTMFQDPDFVGSLFNTLLWVVGTLLVPVGARAAARPADLEPARAASGCGSRSSSRTRSPASASASSGRSSCRRNGALDQALASSVSSTPPRWLLDAPLNTVVMIIAAAWQGVGVNALLFTIGLQSIPKEPLEAARVDGATRRSGCSAACSGRCCARSPPS